MCSSRRRKEESNRLLLRVISLTVVGISLAVAACVLIRNNSPRGDDDEILISGGGGNSLEGTGDNNTSSKNGSIAAEPGAVQPSLPAPAPQYQFIQCDREGTGDCCNGLDSICDLRADEVLYATLHNGMATFEDGFAFGPNHNYQLERSLEAGYRGLNLDLCNCGGETTFCHGEYNKNAIQLS